MNPESIFKAIALSLLIEKRLEVTSPEKADVYEIHLKTVPRNQGRLLGRLGSIAMAMREMAKFLSREIRIIIDDPEDNVELMRDEHKDASIETFAEMILQDFDPDWTVSRDGNNLTIHTNGSTADVTPDFKVAVERVFFAVARARRDYIVTLWK
jgi:predicted RNA-binding protein YlqC (UPF0109 family)